MGYSLETVRQLREATSAGVMDCKEALAESNGDMTQAIEILRKKGLQTAAKKSTRQVKEGQIGSYVHLGGKIGVLVEIACETDFVARCGTFQTFVRDLAMQIAAARPEYVSEEQIPQAVIEKEKEIVAAQISGKPAHVLEKIVQGKLEKRFAELCLLKQPFIKDAEITIQDYLTRIIAEVGENVVVRRFVRFELGESTA